ncbi:hypothetical protein F8M41_004649 [Gigaspora margarita]|uniref:Uncharacterized protein n=1 Tax=Gigaspora margarita TaxID=4874 RepID=A0A8H3XCF0_GIGMA|nr:hypothetical protein F8M41_004649 [Gigaspora margarita]
MSDKQHGSVSIAMQELLVKKNNIPKEKDEDNEIIDGDRSKMEIPENNRATEIIDYIKIPKFMKPIIKYTINNTDYYGNKGDEGYVRNIPKIIIFFLIFPIRYIINSIVFYMLFLCFHWRRVISHSFISTILAIFTFFITISFNESFDKFKVASYLLYLSAVVQYLISKELMYLLFSFLGSYCLLVYGIMYLNIDDLESLRNQHPLYLSLLFIFIFLSQLLNIIFVTTPTFLYADFFDTIYGSNIIFVEMLHYHDMFKPFITIFLSRGLSASEKNMLDNFDFDHQHKKLYFWVSKDMKLSRYDHVSFDKKSFDFLKELDDIKTKGQFKLHYLEDNYYIFILMLFVDFY